MKTVQTHIRRADSQPSLRRSIRKSSPNVDEVAHFELALQNLPLEGIEEIFDGRDLPRFLAEFLLTCILEGGGASPGGIRDP